MRNRMLFWLLLGGGAFVLLAVVTLSLVIAYGGDRGGDLAFGDRIQVVDVDGELVDSRPIIEQLKRYEDNKSVRAILLNVDSPGGGVAVSQEIYKEIKRLRQERERSLLRTSRRLCVGRLLHLSAGHQDRCQSRHCGRQHRRDRGMDKLWRPDAVGEA